MWSTHGCHKDVWKLWCSESPSSMGGPDEQRIDQQFADLPSVTPRRPMLIDDRHETLHKTWLRCRRYFGKEKFNRMTDNALNRRYESRDPGLAHWQPSRVKRNASSLESIESRPALADNVSLSLAPSPPCLKTSPENVGMICISPGYCRIYRANATLVFDAWSSHTFPHYETD